MCTNTIQATLKRTLLIMSHSRTFFGLGLKTHDSIGLKRRYFLYCYNWPQKRMVGYTVYMTCNHREYTADLDHKTQRRPQYIFQMRVKENWLTLVWTIRLKSAKAWQFLCARGANSKVIVKNWESQQCKQCCFVLSNACHWIGNSRHYLLVIPT